MELINIKQKISLKSDLILHKDKDRTDNIGIILASGTSTRFRQKKQKQIYPINYIPMFVYSLDVFLNTLDEVVIVTNKDCVEQMKNIIDRVYKDDKKLIHFIINDVDSRMESINLALDFIDKNRTNTKNIVIHDCCIPFVKEEMIELILEELSNINVYHSQYYLEIENETIYKNVDGFFKPDDFDGIIKLSTPFGIDFKLCCFLFNSYMKNNRITREFIFLFKVLNIKYSLIKGYENELKKIVYIDDIDDTIEIHKSKTLSSKNIIDLS
jgi:2-C-methyl-D-erythritol 4-phosphate cytidylyltransferase